MHNYKLFLGLGIVTAAAIVAIRRKKKERVQKFASDDSGYLHIEASFPNKAIAKKRYQELVDKNLILIDDIKLNESSISGQQFCDGCNQDMNEIGEVIQPCCVECYVDTYTWEDTLGYADEECDEPIDLIPEYEPEFKLHADRPDMAYHFHELDDDVKDRMIEEYRESNNPDGYDWWDYLEDGFVEDMEKKGFDIDAGRNGKGHAVFWRGFWSQGDGASFEASVDGGKFIKSHKLGNQFRRIMAKLRKGFWVGGQVSQSGSYVHHMTMSFRIDDDFDNYGPGMEDELRDLEDIIEETARDYANDYYHDLDKEYEWLTSDKYISDDLEDMSWYTEEGDERGPPRIASSVKEFILHAGDGVDKDYVWISKIYDIISLSKYNLEAAEWEMLEAGITVDDLSQMVDDGLIDIDVFNDKIVLKEKMYEYIHPEVLRDNWVYLEPTTRRRFVNRKAIPKIFDILADQWRPATKLRGIDMTSSDDAWLDKKRVKDYFDTLAKDTRSGKLARARLHNMIVNYYKKRSKDFYVVSSMYLPPVVLSSLSSKMPYVRFVDTFETCPIGLNKEECESYWRQIGGEDQFAYKDFTIDAVNVWSDDDKHIPIRLYLSRYYRGVYFEIKSDDARDYNISYKQIYDLLKGDDVLDVIKDAPYLRNWVNVTVDGKDYKESMGMNQRRTPVKPVNDRLVFMNKHGFFPIFNRKRQPLID